MHNTAAREAPLLSRRAELLVRLEDVEEGLEGQGTSDWEDLAAEREDDEVFEHLGQSAAVELSRIDAALGRIAAGEYGYCVKCGALISEERLDLLPYTPFCRACAP